MSCCLTRSTNTQAASHLVHYGQSHEWDVAPSLAGDGQDDDETDELFRHSSHQHKGLRSDDTFGGPSREDELFATTIPGTSSSNSMLMCILIWNMSPCNQFNCHHVLSVNAIFRSIDSACSRSTSGCSCWSCMQRWCSCLPLLIALYRLKIIP